MVPVVTLDLIALILGFALLLSAALRQRRRERQRRAALDGAELYARAVRLVESDGAAAARLRPVVTETVIPLADYRFPRRAQVIRGRR